MSYVKGVSLSNLLKKLNSIDKRLSMDKVKKISKNILSALK